MNALINFAFEDNLVRVIERDGEPWFAGKDVCGALGLSGPAANHLRNLDEDEKGMYTIHTLGGDQSMIVISEPGVYRLVFRSRKPEAERFKRWLAHDVIPQIRKTGEFRQAAAPAPDPFEVDIQHAPLSAKVEYLRLVMRLRGRNAAVRLMPSLGLPDIDMRLAGLEITPDGPECLAHILGWRNEEGISVRSMIVEAATSGRLHMGLRALGLRVVLGDDPGLAVAINPRAVEPLFAGTQWSARRHVAALRGLPGTSQVRMMKFGNGIASHAIFVPDRLLEA